MIEPLANVEGISDKRQATWDQYMAWRARLAEAQTQSSSPAIQGAPNMAESDGQPPLAGEDQGLTEAQKRELEELRRCDREVRQHEQAHLKAAGQHALGSAHYVYKRGPDGRMYAIDGEVMIDVSPVEGDPHATLQKAQQLRRAALAPTNPSPQDQSVAARASRMEQEARREIFKEARARLDQSSSFAPIATSQPHAAASANDRDHLTEGARTNDEVQRLIKDTPKLVGLDTIAPQQHVSSEAEQVEPDSYRPRPSLGREFVV